MKRQGKIWPLWEDIVLIAMWNENFCRKQISEYLGRSEDSVKTRLWRVDEESPACLRLRPEYIMVRQNDRNGGPTAFNYPANQDFDSLGYFNEETIESIEFDVVKQVVELYNDKYSVLEIVAETERPLSYVGKALQIAEDEGLLLFDSRATLETYDLEALTSFEPQENEQVAEFDAETVDASRIQLSVNSSLSVDDIKINIECPMTVCAYAEPVGDAIILRFLEV